jgi:hypothetical protein
VMAIDANNRVPLRSLSNGQDWTKALKSLSYLSAVAIPLLSSSSKARAVGDLFEFKDQTMVIQDIAFNVGNTQKDSDALATLFQNNIRTLRTDTTNNLNTTVLGFGPDAYKRYAYLWQIITEYICVSHRIHYIRRIQI